jgi:hypothetical protein
VEIIVARAATAAELVELSAAIPGVRWLGAPPSTTIAQLRGLGMSESTGDIVALIEDRRVAADGWIDALLRCQDDPARARNDDLADIWQPRAIDWRMYFAENAFFAERSERSERQRGTKELAGDFGKRPAHRNGDSHAGAR